MARYFFHSQDGHAYRDPDGLEFADHAAARAEATLYVAELLREDGDAFWRHRKLQVIVTDAAGVRLCVLTVTGDDAPDQAG